MDMSMSFSSWSSYETTIIWGGWQVTTRWQFALSCLAVLAAAISFHALRHRIYLLESYMAAAEGLGLAAAGGAHSAVYDQIGAADGSCCDGIPEKLGLEGLLESQNRRADSQGSLPPAPARTAIDSRHAWLRGVHAFASACNYAVALFLMLVAMTYNPSLFLMLVVGYAIGDFVFYHKMKIHIPATECH